MSDLRDYIAAFDRIVDALQKNGSIVTISSGGDKATAQCPNHDDCRASLSIGLRDDGKGVVVYCHAGCQVADILAALGLAMPDLYDDPRMRAAYNGRATYVYPDGRKVHRAPDKKFRQSGNTQGRSVFHADRITADTTTIYITEGEKDVLAAESVGAVAVCSAMGACKAHKFDWSPLGGKDVIVVADKDEPGRKHASQVVGAVVDDARSVRVVEAAAGKDLADHIAAGHTLDELVVVHYDEPKPEKRSTASQLVDMARLIYDLGISDDGTPYGTRPDVPHVAMPLRGGRLGLRAELARRYFEKHATVASQQALADALTAVEGFAGQEKPRRLHLRFAEHNGTVYIDLADTSDRVIAINDGQWAFADHHVPVVFRRTVLTAPMPDPVRGGDLTKLWKFINIAEADRPILLAVKVAAVIQPDVPHVILAFLAEHGSAKSSSARYIVSLIDPSVAPLRMPPRDIDGWVTAANGSWVVALDNLSNIPDWLSDALCRASTGDGHVKRQLYTDADLTVIKYKRVIILNGIDLGGLNGDLTERLAPVDLLRITDDDRKAETRLEAEWEQARPAILVGLLDLAAQVHHRLPTLNMTRLPRMADFARILACVDSINGTAG